MVAEASGNDDAVNAFQRNKNKAPQVGLEPTTLRLTEGFHVPTRIGKNLGNSFIERRGGAALRRCSKILLRRVLDLPRYLPARLEVYGSGTR